MAAAQLDHDRETALAFEPAPSPVSPEERARRLADPGFGRVFTDHMALIEYDEERAGTIARITAREPFTLDPAAPVLHYAQEIFEGLKAYRRPNGGAALFRPDANARRFASSARRLAMPELPEEMFLESIRALVRAEREWIPEGDDGSLYLRPFMFASGAFLGVRPASQLHLRGDRFRGRTLFQRRGAKRVAVGDARIYPRRARRDRRRKMRRQLCREPRRAGRSDPQRDATRSCSSTRSSGAGSRNSAG